MIQITRFLSRALKEIVEDSPPLSPLPALSADKSYVVHLEQELLRLMSEEKYDDARVVKTEMARMLEPSQKAQRMYERDAEAAMWRQLATAVPRTSLMSEINR